MTENNQDEIRKWHRWFAVECNNRAWDLAAEPQRSEQEAREMLNAAYAAAYHWSQVGDPINDARAELLQAHAHAVLGQGGEALHYAMRCLEFCEKKECEDWDLAFAHANMAFAAAVSGNERMHAHHYQTASKLGEAIAEDGERKVFFAEFARIPATVVTNNS